MTKQPIIAVTPDPHTARQMALIRNAYPLLIRPETSFDQLTHTALKEAQKTGRISSGDRIVVTAGLPLNVPGNTNLIKVETIL